MGKALVALRRFDEAIKAFGAAVVLDATSTAAYREMSNVLLEMGQTEEAEQAGEKALQYGDEEDEDQAE